MDTWDQFFDKIAKWVEKPSNVMMFAAGALLALIAIGLLFEYIPSWIILILIVLGGFKLWLRLWVQFRRMWKDSDAGGV